MKLAALTPSPKQTIFPSYPKASTGALQTKAGLCTDKIRHVFDFKKSKNQKNQKTLSADRYAWCFLGRLNSEFCFYVGGAGQAP
jgi:hypothetical protein